MKIELERDELNNQANLRRHGISFEEAKEIFDGFVFTLEDTRHHYGERRFVSIGILLTEIILVVAHTKRRDCTRIISARKANKHERTSYYDHIKEAIKGGQGH